MAESSFHRSWSIAVTLLRIYILVHVVFALIQSQFNIGVAGWAVGWQNPLLTAVIAGVIASILDWSAGWSKNRKPEWLGKGWFWLNQALDGSYGVVYICLAIGVTIVMARQQVGAKALLAWAQLVLLVEIVLLEIRKFWILKSAEAKDLEVQLSCTADNRIGIMTYYGTLVTILWWWIPLSWKNPLSIPALVSLILLGIATVWKWLDIDDIKKRVDTQRSRVG